MKKFNYKDYKVKDNMIHQPPMLLVDEILEEDEVNGKTIYKIKEDCIFIDELGTFSRAALVEVAAQSIAAVDIFQKKQKNLKVTKGFLTSVRDFVFFDDAKAGDTIICEAEKTDEMGQLKMAVAKIKNFENGKLLAEGEIRIYEIPD